MKKHAKKIIISITVFLIAIVGLFFAYVSDFYEADTYVVEEVMAEDYVLDYEDYIVLEGEDASEEALIFYPGAKVEHSAYLPLLEKVREATGMTIILVKMPFNMAIFDVDAADKIIEEFTEIKKWYIGGHSMGGAMASNYASKHPETIEALVLIAAYPYGEYPLEKTLTVYGSLNTSVAEEITYEENVIVIEGGNHAQFGNYGQQAGDEVATISQNEQQNQAVKAIKDFIETLN